MIDSNAKLRSIQMPFCNIDGVNITELINKAAEKGYSLRVVDDRDSTETPATYASPHQLL
ncbi:DUF5983 family protein [Escherichia coli]|nr:DUF5983 family protein [Escherichia coli]MCZ6216670.1 DUF5983 family protein [Escherichia coli]